MTDRLVVIPATVFSPRTVDLVPATRALLDDLRSEFEVEVYRWPYMKGAAGGQVTWESEAREIEELFGDHCHVFCFGGTAGLALVPIGRSRAVATFISDGLFPPPGTLRRVGAKSVAEAAEVTLRSARTGLSQYVRFLTSEGEAADFIKLLDQEIDWGREQDHAESYIHLDLLREVTPISVPALCLQLPIPIAGYDEEGSIFRRLVPGVSFEPLEPWGFSDTFAGAKLAERVAGFIRQAASLERDGAG